MQNILEKIAASTVERVAEEKKKVSLAEMRGRAEAFSEARRKAPAADQEKSSFLHALQRPGLSYICEVKKASPSKGLIAPDFPYLEIAREYEEAGAAAISCLTEPFYFQGADRYLEEIAAEVAIPVLRKDFVVDEYMVYGARALGASAVLLLCNILDDSQLKEYRLLAEELGMDALVEAYDGAEHERALKSGAKIVGVNNRDLRTFEVDTGRSVAFRKETPSDVVFVSESGIRDASDIAKLKTAGVDAVLIGETLMRARDKRLALAQLSAGVGLSQA